MQLTHSSQEVRSRHCRLLRLHDSLTTDSFPLLEHNDGNAQTSGLANFVVTVIATYLEQVLQ